VTTVMAESVTTGWETIDVAGHIDPFIEDRVRRVAEHGWLAIAPDLFHRQPSDGAPPIERVQRLRDAEIIADVAATLDYIKEREDAIRWHVAVIGFCMGGRCAYLAASAIPTAWCAAGVFYGGNIMVPWGDGVPSPFERTPSITCPMIGFFGNDDPNPSPADVDRIDAELARCGVAHDFHRYDGAGHAFLNFTNAERHRPAAAEDAWAKLLAFLDRHLTPGAA
jgi:carboxymethylenebutenolidase